MDMQELLKYIKPELLVLVPACWGFGLMIKPSKINSGLIPTILGIFSVFMACLWVIGTGGTNLALGAFTGIVQGLICFAIEWLIYEKGIRKIGS